MKKQLNLFEDENGFIRLKGRIGNAEINFDNKFPILLNEMSHVTKLFVIDAHKRVKHSGVNGTLNELRSRFWISSGRNVVKRCIRECIPCKRINGKVLLGPPPPDLPGYRVASDFAFTNIGVDYAGPLFVKNIYSETDEMHKAYICLFTCASTRNVHLELTRVRYKDFVTVGFFSLRNYILCLVLTMVFKRKKTPTFSMFSIFLEVICPRTLALYISIDNLCGLLLQ